MLNNSTKSLMGEVKIYQGGIELKNQLHQVKNGNPIYLLYMASYNQYLTYN